MTQTRMGILGTLAASASIAIVPEVRADITTSPYQLIGTYTLPGNTYDMMPDGRLLSIAGDGTVSIQDAINGSAYSAVGSIGQINADGFDPAFVAISPDGSTLAVGNNEFNAGNAVSFFDTTAATSGTALALSSIITPNFTADWSDNQTLYVTGADASSFDTIVNRLDVSSGSSTTVISPAGGFSGGVAVYDGDIYAGEGDTGDVYSFDLPTLAAATGPAAITTGNFVTSHSSAGSIDFDTSGNIIIAGGVFDFGAGSFSGSAAIIDPITQAMQVLTPAGLDTFYGAFFNDATGQLVVTADGTAYVFVVPSPTTAAPMLVALAALRRRRTR